MTSVTIEKKDMTAIATIDRPKANQLSTVVLDELSEILNKYRDDPGIRVLIITGGGDKIFSAGADLSEGFGSLTALEYIKKGQILFNDIEDYPKPVIAAMNGHAFGGGLELAMACHLRVMKKGARIGLVETNLGIIPGYGGTLRLPKLIGTTKALEYILTAREIEADRAFELGLINRTCRNGMVLSDTMEMAKTLAERPPLAVKAVLKLFASARDLNRDDYLKMEREELAPLIGTEDMKEGLTAFAQKRKPLFRGK